MPLEQAAQQFDNAYRLLLSAPPDDVSTPGGFIRVLERHSCVYGTRRFAHVVMQYKGRVVSLLMTRSDGAAKVGTSLDGSPHRIGRATDELSVVSVDGPQHAILLVSDLESAELTQLSTVVSVPLAQRLEGSLIPANRGDLAALLIAAPVHLP